MLERPIDVKPKTTNGFSALNAKTHLDIMASETHFMGTAANRKVKNYIRSEFDKLNIPTELFIGTTHLDNQRSYKRIGQTENIIATIKGENSEKAVVLCAHYDSVAEGPGAADDVHAVACMLEIARLLQIQKFKNDIIFLITDGEENGLFGARAYSETKDLSNIGLILNYEARGNSGPSISFEWSDENGYLVRQLKKVAHRPVASSMSYEVYKLLPNDTDYSNFKPKGIPGINHAFIDGFTYYHNPDDTPKTISLKSVQHTGENMFLMTKHFADLDLTNLKAPNASFFNLLGQLIVYPSSADIYLIALALILLLILVVLRIKNKTIKSGNLIGGILYIFIMLLVSLAIAYLIGYLVLKFYPNYNVFYSGQYYNHTWYLGVTAGSTILVFWSMITLIKNKIDQSTLGLSAIIFISLLIPITLYFTPTGVYIILIPLLCLTLSLLLRDFFKSSNKKELRSFCSLLFNIAPIALWVPITHSIFLAFSLMVLPAPAFTIFLLCLSLLISCPNFYQNKLIGILGGIIFLGCFVIAHLKSKPTEKHPLPSRLNYVYKADTDQAFIATENSTLNIGNQEKLQGAQEIQLVESRPYTSLAVSTEIKPHIPISRIENDTTNNLLKVVRPEESYHTRLIIPNSENISKLFINYYELDFKGQGSSQTIDIYGMTQDTMRISVLKIDETIKDEFILSNRYQSLPFEDKVPKGVRRADPYSDIMQNVSI